MVRRLRLCRHRDLPRPAAGQIHEAIATAYARRGVALLNIPQDVFDARTSKTAFSPATLRPPPEIAPAAADLDAAAQILDAATSVTVFVGHGGRAAKAEILALCDRLKAPIVHTYLCALDLFHSTTPGWSVVWA